MWERGANMKNISLCFLGFLALASCRNDADVASTNLSTEADSFHVNRRVVFYNGITGEVLLKIEGLCSLGNEDTSRRMSVTCKIGENSYKKHFMGLSNNVTFVAEQLDPLPVNVYHDTVIFKPELIIPHIEVK